jgi:hypothetical protein
VFRITGLEDSGVQVTDFREDLQVLDPKKFTHFYYPTLLLNTEQ